MPSLLLRNALVAATMDSARRGIDDASVLIEGHWIHSVARSAEIDAWIAADPAHRTPLASLDLGSLVERHNRISHRMLQSAGLA